ncbi:MAG TPA: hypothetical protein VMW52_09900, partial [Phycisphaerae bacterium]|nr:hypothetical protein [Phycisphaerae bacterium]
GKAASANAEAPHAGVRIIQCFKVQEWIEVNDLQRGADPEKPDALMAAFGQPEPILSRLGINLFGAVGIFWARTAPEWPSWRTDPDGVPLDDELIRLIELLEVLCLRWGIEIDAVRPAEGDLADSAPQAEARPAEAAKGA